MNTITFQILFHEDLSTRMAQEHQEALAEIEGRDKLKSYHHAVYNLILY